MNTQETLAPNKNIGEVDPRSYTLLGLVKFKTSKIGSHERLSEVSRLHRAIDTIISSEGDKHARVHLTLAPGMDAKKTVEVRLQPLTMATVKEEESFVKRVQARWSEIIAKGIQEGWEAVS
jgi:hypothetical protein